MPEVYSIENKQKHRTFNSAKGENNHNALYSNSEVLQARNYYTSHTLYETYKKYGHNSVSLGSFRCVLTKGYTSIPVFSKKRNV